MKKGLVGRIVHLLIQICLVLGFYSCGSGKQSGKDGGFTGFFSDKPKPKKKLKWSNKIETDNLHIDVVKKVLSNGLTVLIVPNSHLPLLSYYTFYKVGSRYEPKGLSGASHFLEHLMFKGAKKYGPGKFDTAIEGSGGVTNAYTTKDLTVYYENLPSTQLELLIDMEADRMENLLLEKEAFEKERFVILEERKMRLENSPIGKLYTKMMETAFAETPYETSTIGTVDDIKKVQRYQIFDYFKKFYAPNNAVLVIVGDVDSNKTMGLVEKYYGKIPRSNFIDSLEENEQKISEEYRFKKKFPSNINLKGQSVNPQFLWVYKGAKHGEHWAYVLDILASVLGDGGSSYLVQRYVNNRRPLLSRVYASNYNLKFSGVFFIGGELLGGKSLKLFEKGIRKSMFSACESAVTERSIQKTKNQYLLDYYHALETNAGMAQFVGLREVTFKDYENYKKELKIYSNITTEEVLQACKQVFASKDNMFLTIWRKN